MEKGKITDNYKTLRTLRTLTGLTQKQFAMYYKIPYSTYAKWETSPESVDHREVPTYVLSFLQRCVQQDFGCFVL